MYQKFFKRFFDFTLSALGLIILSPVLLITYLLIVIFLGFPGIFRQNRPGKNEKIFKLYKFRTMSDARDKNGNLLPNEQRLTKFGKLLRSTSIDELPELFNILKGDMSFVGPRPLHVDYLKFYNKEQKKRHNVRPGLTGWAQVNGRNSISWTEKFTFDTYYVEHLSLKLDLKILSMTAFQVVHKENIYTANGNFTERFNGNN